VHIDATQYEDITNVSSTGFSLVIKNYTESDLIISYTCSCGFKSYTKHLALNDKDFIGKYIDWYISSFDKILGFLNNVSAITDRQQRPLRE
jgi:hypothetical protein